MSSDPGSAWFGSGERSASSGLGHNARLIGTAVAAFVSVLGLALFLHLYICHVRRRNRRRLAAALPTTAPPPKGGLEAAAIAALPTAVYGNKEEADAAECSICLGGVEEGDTVRLLPACGHVFHVPCVDTWLTSSSSCPVCRAGVEPPPPPPAAGGAAALCVMEKPMMEKAEEAGSSAPVRAIIGASLMKMLSRERPLVRRPQVADAGELDFDLERQQQEQQQAANNN
ncbi:hypothetical protein PR202_ga09614 [Eleusine coracana subsp. coracana]|uniref:RING-type E3 ubiquitin transferase n=1 Tax=Eleusine coracana subsp. coracana TaxID=191504 RepID=A0AAV5C3A3_ELECO|nr:hypothetical protein PR202_ga09614 [Eleusine coracana subsp. coracana]